MRTIHTETVSSQMASREAHPLLQRQPPDVSQEELRLPREKRRQLAQLRARKSPLLNQYLHNIGKAEHPNCLLCMQAEHTTEHLFLCQNIPTTLTPEHLWREPIAAAELGSQWEAALALVQGA